VISIGFAREENSQLCVSRLEDGEPMDAGSRIDALLMSRLDFDIQILEIPPVSDKELEGLLRYRLRSIYPGNPSETAFDYRVAGTGAKRRAILFICPSAVLDRYRTASAQKPLLLPYSITCAIARKKGDAVIVFFHQDWVELSVYWGGILSSSTVYSREEGHPFDFARAADSLPPEVRSLPIVVVAAPRELKEIEQSFNKDELQRAAFLTFAEAAREWKSIDALFKVQNKRSLLLSPAFRIGALAAATAALSIQIFLKFISAAEGRYDRLRTLQSALEVESRRIVVIEEEVNELTREISGLEAREPLDVYLLFSELSAVLGSETRIRNLTIRDNGFQIEAVGSNPLKLMDGFRNRLSFSDVRLSQVIPDAKSGKERFSFSGVFHAR
jgi:hypothetical protein